MPTPRPKGRPATFGEFGVGFVREVFTPSLIGRHLDAALAGLSFDTTWWPNLASARFTVVQPGDPHVVGDERCERILQVPVTATLAARFGGGAVSAAVDVDVDLDLTIRVRTFAPATVFLAIDPVTPQDVRVDVRAMAGWDAWAAAAAIVLGEVVERFAPQFAGALNPTLAQTVQQRTIDVLARVLTARASDPANGPVLPARAATHPVPTVPADQPLTGVIGFGEQLEWGVWLAAGERVDLDLWAGIVDRPNLGSPGVLLHLGVRTPSGRTLPDAYEATLVANTWVPDFQSTAPADVGPTFTARRPGVHRLRLTHTEPLSDEVPVAFRIQQRRTYTAITGKRSCFDEFGDALIRNGINRDLVAGAIAAELPTADRQPLPGLPVPVATVVTARLARLDAFVPKDTTPDRQLWFRPVFAIDIELEIGDDGNRTVLAARLEARASLKVTTLVEPATIVIAFDPVPETDVRLVGDVRHVRGRKIPFASWGLGTVLPGQVAAQLDAQLAEAAVRIEVGAAADAVPVPAPPDRNLRPLRARATFSGVCPVESERYHAVHLAAGQKVTVTARLAIDRKGGGYGGGMNVDVAMVDQHGGVWEHDFGTLRAIGKRRQSFEFTFAAPYAGDWRVRLRETYVGVDAPGFRYEVTVTP